MIADVGCIEKVRGSRIATPFAPPSPGRMPMIMPSTMPITIRITLNGMLIVTPKMFMSRKAKTVAKP